MGMHMIYMYSDTNETHIYCNCFFSFGILCIIHITLCVLWCLFVLEMLTPCPLLIDVGRGLSSCVVLCDCHHHPSHLDIIAISCQCSALSPH